MGAHYWRNTRQVQCAAASPRTIALAQGPLRLAASRATTLNVTKPVGDNDLGSAWDAVRSDGEIQFAPLPQPPPQAPPEDPPDWLNDFFEWLGDLFAPLGRFLVLNWSWLQWVIIALVVGLLLFALWRLIDPATLRLRRRGKTPVEAEELRLDQGQALALLDAADRLAAEGRFDEATHLLLQRSVGQIAELRPDLIDPSSTAREIAALPALPGPARNAFGTIAGRVEASLFALTRLTAEDWQAARTAYADFAIGYRGVVSA